ncbi:MAG: 3-oxoacyl-ACP synthase III [Planctomycetales bacterium]
MRYQHVCVEAFSYSLPPLVVSSAEIETRLAPIYQRFHLPAGRLELMTGIRERRFWERGVLPGHISAQTADQAILASGIDRRHLEFLVHGSVCRDQLEPATASGVHHALRLPQSALVFDVSNACLGLLDGMVLLANLIELGQVRAGIVVGTEMGRDLVEGTIDSLLSDPQLTKQDFKRAFASLTIGSGSAAIVLCDRKLSRSGLRLQGGAWQTDTSSHELCAGGVASEQHGDDRPRMQTDSEALLHAGINLAESAWEATRRALGWSNDDVSRAFTHQVGRAHRKLLYERLGLDPAIDFSTVEFLGNTGAAALPLTAALGMEQQPLRAGQRVALLGIGSGLNALMLGMEGGRG